VGEEFNQEGGIQAYPSHFALRDRHWMLYNGMEFGLTGFGVAEIVFDSDVL
jgi:hypothetical protein